MQSPAATVEQYLASLPADRRAVVEAVRGVILQNLDADYEEGMQYGMISYHVPHRVYPPGYHCDPTKALPFAGLASQKNHMSLYLMCVYGSEEQRTWFCDAWQRTGKKLDMGKACIRFKKLEDLPLEVIGEAIRRVPAKGYVAHYEMLLATPRTSSSGSTAKAKPAQKKPAKKKPAKKKPAVAKTTAAPTSAARKKAAKKKAGKQAATAKKSPPKKTPTKKALRKKAKRRAR